MFHRQVALSPADLLIFRLITSLTPFFFGFEVPPTIGLFIPGRWITFAEATAYHLRNAVNFFRDVPARPIHDLPDGSVVLELVSRPVHYQLYGAGLTRWSAIRKRLGFPKKATLGISGRPNSAA